MITIAHPEHSSGELKMFTWYPLLSRSMHLAKALLTNTGNMFWWRKKKNINTFWLQNTRNVLSGALKIFIWIPSNLEQCTSNHQLQMQTPSTAPDKALFSTKNCYLFLISPQKHMLWYPQHMFLLRNKIFSLYSLISWAMPPSTFSFCSPVWWQQNWTGVTYIYSSKSSWYHQ